MDLDMDGNGDGDGAQGEVWEMDLDVHCNADDATWHSIWAQGRDNVRDKHCDRDQANNSAETM